jgi:hypothetical protein
MNDPTHQDATCCDRCEHMEELASECNISPSIIYAERDLKAHNLEYDNNRKDSITELL